MLERYKENGNIAPKRFYNGIVRGKETIILFNLGKTSAGLDAYIYPIQNMEANSIELSQGAGAHKLRLQSAFNKEDEIKIKASTRECLRNNSPTAKEGFFNIAACDSKHNVKLEDKKSARSYLNLRKCRKAVKNYELS